VTVLEFPARLNLNNVPEMLRVLADQIESGDYGNAVGLAYVFNTAQGDLLCNSFGPINQIEAVGMLTMAANMLAIGEA
jgi:hypothetical protein